MADYEIQFPPEVSRGFVGGPAFRTNVVVMGSGYESRGIRWSSARREYDATHLLKIDDDRDDILAFFHIAEGKAHSFRIKDWTDYKLIQEPLVQQPVGQLTLPATQRQIVQTYSFGLQTYQRIVSKPLASMDHTILTFEVRDGTMTPLVEGVDYTVDTTTGIITFDVDPGNADITCEFDVPVRFDSDKIEVTQEVSDRATIPVRFVEVKIPFVVPTP